jgi:hypothetical protein
VLAGDLRERAARGAALARREELVPEPPPPPVVIHGTVEVADGNGAANATRAGS